MPDRLGFLRRWLPLLLAFVLVGGINLTPQLGQRPPAAQATLLAEEEVQLPRAGNHLLHAVARKRGLDPLHGARAVRLPRTAQLAQAEAPTLARRVASARAPPSSRHAA